MRHVTRLRTSVLLLATALLFLSPRARGQEDAFSALASVADAELRGTRTPGAAVALVRNDRVVYARGFGVANVETREPVSPEMLFRLGLIVTPGHDGKPLYLHRGGRAFKRAAVRQTSSQDM